MNKLGVCQPGNSSANLFQDASDVLLTIAIPTYNRHRYLAELIPVLLAQMDQINSDKTVIELLIVDNASSDGTGQYIESLDQRSYLKYCRNEKNIGGDANFLMCIKGAIGKYVWLFGDDELVVDSGVMKVLDVVNEGRYDLIVAKDMDYITGLKSSRHFDNFKEFTSVFSKINAHFILAHTLITSNIFKKSSFDIAFAYGLLHTNYAHMYGLLNGLKNRGSVYVFNEPIIKVRDIRPDFAEPIVNLLQTQKAYINFVGHTFDNEKMKIYARNFYRAAIARQICINFFKRVPFAKKLYKLLTS